MKSILMLVMAFTLLSEPKVAINSQLATNFYNEIITQNIDFEYTVDYLMSDDEMTINVWCDEKIFIVYDYNFDALLKMDKLDELMTEYNIKTFQFNVYSDVEGSGYQYMNVVY